MAPQTTTSVHCGSQRPSRKPTFFCSAASLACRDKGSPVKSTVNSSCKGQFSSPLFFLISFALYLLCWKWWRWLEMMVAVVGEAKAHSTAPLHTHTHTPLERSNPIGLRDLGERFHLEVIMEGVLCRADNASAGRAERLRADPRRLSRNSPCSGVVLIPPRPPRDRNKPRNYRRAPVGEMRFWVRVRRRVVS